VKARLEVISSCEKKSLAFAGIFFCINEFHGTAQSCLDQMADAR
jgi:hypothetical protein